MKQTMHIRLQGNIPRRHQDAGCLLTSVWRSKRIVHQSWDSSVSIEKDMGSMAVVQFLADARVRLYSTASRPALGPIHPPIQWMLDCPPWRLRGPVWNWPHPQLVQRPRKIELYLHSFTYLHAVVLNYAQRLPTFFTFCLLAFCGFNK
jgi:hypothetical protein